MITVKELHENFLKHEYGPYSPPLTKFYRALSGANIAWVRIRGRQIEVYAYSKKNAKILKDSLKELGVCDISIYEGQSDGWRVQWAM